VTSSIVNSIPRASLKRRPNSPLARQNPCLRSEHFFAQVGTPDDDGSSQATAATPHQGTAAVCPVHHGAHRCWTCQNGCTIDASSFRRTGVVGHTWSPGGCPAGRVNDDSRGVRRHQRRATAVSCPSRPSLTRLVGRRSPERDTSCPCRSRAGPLGGRTELRRLVPASDRTSHQLLGHLVSAASATLKRTYLSCAGLPHGAPRSSASGRAFAGPKHPPGSRY